MSKLYPTIIGMNPPTKEVIIFPLGKDGKEGGFDVWIFHADFPEGTKRGSRAYPVERHGMSAWLRFTDADVMEKFGMQLVKVAKKYKRKEPKE